MRWGWLCGCVAGWLLAACGGEVDVNTDAPAHDAGTARLEGGALADTKREVALDVNVDVPVAEPFDWCSVPEPGPCCCDPLNLLLTLDGDAGPEGCRFVLPKRAHLPYLFNLQVVGDPTVFLGMVSGPDDCVQGGFYYLETDPIEIVLCSATCDALRASGPTTLHLVQGCYTIACPPP